MARAVAGRKVSDHVGARRDALVDGSAARPWQEAQRSDGERSWPVPKASRWHLPRSSWQSETIGPADGRGGLLARVFISHAGKDETQASGLITGLASVGFEQAFLDFDKHAGIAP